MDLEDTALGGISQSHKDPLREVHSTVALIEQKAERWAPGAGGGAVFTGDRVPFGTMTAFRG